MGEIKRFGQVDYDEIYYIYDKTRLKQSYEELLESYKDEEYAEEMAKDDYFQQALTNSLNGDEVVDLLNQLNDENEELNQKNDLLTLQLDCHKHPLLKENRELVSDLNHELEVSNSLRDVVKELEKENEQLKRLAGGNEEQLLKVMSYLHDNHYDLWEKVNKECFDD